MPKLPQQQGAQTPKNRWQLNDEQISSLIHSPHAFEHVIREVPHQKIHWPKAEALGIQLFIRRDDLIHPYLSGNKLYKLLGHLQHCHKLHPNPAEVSLCSFGGAYSNHLYALAAYGMISRTPTLAVVRGEKPPIPNSTLVELEAMGMTLVHVSRQEYKQKTKADLRRKVEAQYGLKGQCFWIPEGGEGALGQVGCYALGRALAVQKYDMVSLACGTGTTFLGLLSAFQSAKHPTPALVGISALRNNFELANKVFNRPVSRIDTCAHQAQRITLNNQYHFGGFAKTTQNLNAFIENLQKQTSIETERVYTGKLLFGVTDMIEKKRVPEGSKILLIHSGGLRYSSTRSGAP